MRAIVLFAAVIACPAGAAAEPVFRAGIGATYLEVRPSNIERIQGFGPAFDLAVGFRRPSGWTILGSLTVDVALITKATDRNPVAAMELVSLGGGVAWRSPSGDWSVTATLRLATLLLQYSNPPSGSRSAFGFDLRLGRRLLATRAWQLDVELRPGLAWLTPQSEGSGGYQALPSISLGVAVMW